MKIPLRFQMTESDSGKTTLLNAISYLFEREEIDSSLIKNVYKQIVREDNILLKQESLCDFGKRVLNKKKYNLDLKVLSREEVNLKVIKDNMKDKNTCIIMHLYLRGKSHYCLLTDIDNNYIYLFDPYYLDDIYFDEERMVEIIFDNPFEYNRRVNIKRFNNMTMADFALGPIEHRECLIVKKK